jgi:hypothetical protein
MTFSTLLPDVESCRVRTIPSRTYYIISLEPLTDFIIVVPNLSVPIDNTIQEGDTDRIERCHRILR